MKTAVTFVIVTLAIVMPLIAHFGFKLRTGAVRSVLGVNMFAFFGLLAVFTVAMWTGNVNVFADAAETAAAVSTDGMKFLAAALSTGVASIAAIW